MTEMARTPGHHDERRDAMPLIGWVNTDDQSITAEWRDAPSDEDVLARYLRAAYEQCLEFVPHHENPTGDWVPNVPETVPERFKLAQILQARALYNSVITGPDDRSGMEGVGVTVFPMDWSVKNLLRPRRVGGVL